MKTKLLLTVLWLSACSSGPAQQPADLGSAGAPETITETAGHPSQPEPEPEPEAGAGGALAEGGAAGVTEAGASPGGFPATAGAPDGGAAGEAPIDRVALMVGPVGDSLTANHGATNNNGWRQTIFLNSEAAGYPVHAFGTTVGGTFTENRHSGISGCDIACASAASANNFGVGKRFHGLPGVIMILIGSADILNGADPEVTANAYKALCEARFIAAEPTLSGLVVATIPPLPGDPPGVAAYNDALKRRGGIWDQIHSDYPKIRIARVDLFSAIGGKYSANLYIGIHPNDAGYALLGAAYWEKVGPLFDRLTLRYQAK